MKKYGLIIFLLLTGTVIFAQVEPFRALGTPLNPKVDIRWNRFYDYDEVTEICKKMAEAYPQFVTLESIGLSYEERPIWCLVITDKEVGRSSQKPGFYIDGNIHSNEIQGSEIALYTAWYLTESYEHVLRVRQLLREKVFYIIPTINPDARQHFFHEPNTANSPRGGLVPVDNDGDGEIDEDGYDDLDGDGNITSMRRKNPNGRWKTSPDDPRLMIRCRPDEQGEWEMIGSEGIDNDNDGSLNEDGVHFSYDPNRDWGWNWQPNHIQWGAYKYPFSLPETRAVAEFVALHPNIAGVQTYHNNGGMILRGPGAVEDKHLYQAEDNRVYDQIGKTGEEMLPGYRYMTLYKDLYTTYGGEIDWFFGCYGIFSFSNELWTNKYLYQRDNDQTRRGSRADLYQFDRQLLMEEAFVNWKPYDHPDYGMIEIGGFKKSYSRVEPGFMLEQEAHRNMAFTLYHADQMPKLEVDELQVRKLDKDIYEITATIANRKLIPTHAAHDLKYKLSRPDFIRLKVEGKAEVIAGMIVENKDFNLTKEQEFQPEQLRISNIPGMSTVTVRWIVKGETDSFLIEVDSAKGGFASFSTENAIGDQGGE